MIEISDIFNFLGDEEKKALFFKIFIPAFVTVSIKLAIEAKNKTLSYTTVIGSFVTGMGSAYLFGDYVLTNFSHEWQPLVIAVIAISGDKIGGYVMERLHIDSIMEFLNVFIKPKK